MRICNRGITSLILSLTLLAACQEPQKVQEESVTSKATSGNTRGTAPSADSEAVVGPDEAFFAVHYLEQVFHYSKENSHPSSDPSTNLLSLAEPQSAFDFSANFTDKRVAVMVKTLYFQGDSDRDGVLSYSEFAVLKLDPSLLGLAGESQQHNFAQTLFLGLSGNDELMQADECENFLRAMGPVVKSVLDRSSQQDLRVKLIRSWEKILGRYDSDQNGTLSFQEQRDLRQDRALLLSRLGID
jgi:hypothetical protein